MKNLVTAIVVVLGGAVFGMLHLSQRPTSKPVETTDAGEGSGSTVTPIKVDPRMLTLDEGEATKAKEDGASAVVALVNAALMVSGVQLCCNRSTLMARSHSSRASAKSANSSMTSPLFLSET